MKSRPILKKFVNEGLRQSVIMGVHDELRVQLEVRLRRELLSTGERISTYAPMEMLKEAVKFAQVVERLNAMTIDDLYVVAIDRPGDFGVFRRHPNSFGRALVAEAFDRWQTDPLTMWSPPAANHVSAYRAPPFPHRLPNARWRRKGDTVVLTLEGVKHFLDGRVVV